MQRDGLARRGPVVTCGDERNTHCLAHAEREQLN
jgi:hypothetical protein